MTLSLGIDIALVVLLGTSLFYGVMLHRRLASLREDREQLGALIVGLREATEGALAGMGGLREAADTSGRRLESAIERARATVDDLTFLVERGEKATDRLETATRPEMMRAAAPFTAGGSASPLAPATAPIAVAAPQKRGEPEASPARRKLLDALQGMR